MIHITNPPRGLRLSDIIVVNLFPLGSEETVLQASDSDIKVFKLLDPSSPDIVVGKIHFSCFIEVCSRLLFFCWHIEAMTCIFLWVV